MRGLVRRYDNCLTHASMRRLAAWCGAFLLVVHAPPVRAAEPAVPDAVGFGSDHRGELVRIDAPLDRRDPLLAGQLFETRLCEDAYDGHGDATHDRDDRNDQGEQRERVAHAFAPWVEESAGFAAGRGPSSGAR